VARRKERRRRAGKLDRDIDVSLVARARQPADLWGAAT
jgi:hypothetical protein